VLGKIPITGRTMSNYSIQLFPDIKTSELHKHMTDKDYLDIACGINHLYPSSLLCSLKNNKKKHGLDIHDVKQSTKTNVVYHKGTIYKTQFPKESYDCITINNFLYFWEHKPINLLKIYKELYRICKPNGQIRVFPVFFDNYYEDNLELFTYLNENFFISLQRPANDYSKEAPLCCLEKEEIKRTHKDNGHLEYELNHELMAHCLILQKR